MDADQGLLREARDRLTAERRGPEPPGSIETMFALVVFGPAFGVLAAIAGAVLGGETRLDSPIGLAAYLVFLIVWGTFSFSLLRGEETTCWPALLVAMLALVWTTVPWLVLVAVITEGSG